MTTGPTDLYEQDFYAWTQAQARELRRFAATRPNLPLDLPHLAEEIADLGKGQRDGLRSWTARIIEHLLLLEHSRSPEPRRGWIREIVEFRGDIERRLTASLNTGHLGFTALEGHPRKLCITRMFQSAA